MGNEANTENRSGYLISKGFLESPLKVKWVFIVKKLNFIVCTGVGNQILKQFR